MEYIEIAKVVKPHGIRGEIKLQHFCDSANDFDYKILYKKENGEFLPIKVKAIRVDSNAVFIKLDGIISRNDVEEIRGLMFYIKKKDLASLPENAYMIRDLIGINVIDSEKNHLGQLKEILQHGAADVYVVKSKQQNLMFPALKHVICDIDIENRVLVVDKQALSEVVVYED